MSLVPRNSDAAQTARVKRYLSDFRAFSRYAVKTPLYPYQLAPAHTILHSVSHRLGLTIVVMMSRQAGKNELSAQIEAFLLARYQRERVDIVKTAPSYKNQLETSFDRLIATLDNPLTQGRWKREAAAIYVGRARIRFLSGAPGSKVVSATASLLLEVDEAQAFSEDKYNHDFRPMCATTNATTVLYGTAGTEDCLLERALFENRRLQERDGIQRNFIYPWTDVVEYNADYRTAVQAEALRLGTDHPHFLSEYALQTPPSAGRLFSDTSLAQMANSHALPARPALVLAGASALDDDGLSSGKSTSSSSPSFPLTSRTSKPILVAGIDIAGEEEATEGAVARALHPRRDSIAVTITIADIVHPFSFTAVSKSALGYQLLGAVNSGRHNQREDVSAKPRVLDQVG